MNKTDIIKEYAQERGLTVEAAEIELSVALLGLPSYLDDSDVLWAVQLEQYPDSVRVERTDVARWWLFDERGFPYESRCVQVAFALLQHPVGVFYTCLGGEAFGYRYGIEGADYHSFSWGR
jgi:hypothetical protein